MQLKQLVSTLALALSCGLSGQAQAEEVEGLLEYGKPYSAILSMSPESGDLVGYALRNDSAAGKAVLQTCLPDLFCKISNADTQEMKGNTDALKFSDSPSGWYEVKRAKGVEIIAAEGEYEQQAKTRFGTFSVNEENVLLFKGKPVSPVVEGNASLSMVDVQELGNQDLLLVQNNGGTACPALFRVLAVSTQRVQVSAEFGSCSDLYRSSLNGQTYVVQMVDTQVKGAKMVYRWQQGKVTEQRVKPVRP